MGTVTRKSIGAVVLIAVTGMLRCAPMTTAVNVHTGEVASRQAGGAAAVTQPEWVVNNPKWEKVLAFRDVRAATPDGYLKVQVRIENLSTTEVDFETMFEWLDANGMKVSNAVERWAPGQVAARATADIQGVAPSRAAARYRFHIRPPVPLTGSRALAG